MTKRVLLIGVGKMGKELLTLLPQHHMEAAFLLHRGINHQDIPWNAIDCAIDFSTPDNLFERCALIFEKKIPLIQGTTGWEHCREKVLHEAKKQNASFVWANNFSLGVALFKNIVDHAAHLLKNFPDFDVALMEAHHKKKKDAPSGTLLSLQEILLSTLNDRKPGCSMKSSPLSQNDIDTSSLRVGHMPGYHSVWIEGPSESIQITHSARSRSVFAEGALTALDLLLEKPGIWHFDELISQK